MGVKRKLFRTFVVRPIKGFISLLDAVLFKFSIADAMATKSELMSAFENESFEVSTKAGGIKFFVPSAMAYHRARNAMRKEPETIKWIDTFEPGAVFWDIGANVGVYSIYALTTHRDLVAYGFEPAVNNLYSLVRNVGLNGVSDRFVLVPIPLSSMTKTSFMSISSSEIGGALNTFGEDFDWRGQLITGAELKYRTLGFSAEDMLTHFDVQIPNYIKIDVDGIEHLILRGMKNVLTNQAVRSVLVEINEDFADQRDECTKTLADCGFVCAEKRHDPIFMAEGVSNFIFVRP